MLQRPSLRLIGRAHGLVQPDCIYAEVSCHPERVSGSILEELLDQIHVGHQHSSAAVALASDLVHHITVK